MEFKDRPRKMPIEEFLIKRVAHRLDMSEDMVKKVVMHQFQGISKALQKHKSVEMTGFGKWTYVENRAKRKLKELETILEKWEDGEPIHIKGKTIESLKKDIQLIANKITCNDSQSETNS